MQMHPMMQMQQMMHMMSKLDNGKWKSKGKGKGNKKKAGMAKAMAKKRKRESDEVPFVKKQEFVITTKDVIGDFGPGKQTEIAISALPTDLANSSFMGEAKPTEREA